MAKFSFAGKRVWIPGHRGMVGQALIRRLENTGAEILTVDRAQVDLRNQAATEGWMLANKPDAVFLAAATVGGIFANDTRPAEFIYDNLMIESNVINGAWKAGVSKLMFLGSSCIYPKFAAQPMTEDCLMTGPLEPTNEWYAVAKIAGIKLTQAYRRQYGCNFISAMPTNLYGPNDMFDPKASHVVPAMLLKIHDAKEKGAATVPIWGTGTPRREFLHSDDAADALIFLMENYEDEPHLNIGTGQEVTIAELAELVAEVVGFKGEFVYDTSKPDGTPRKLLDVRRLNALGWKPKIGLKEGMAATYQWFLQNQDQLRLKHG